MFKDLKKFQAELDKYHDVNYALKVKIDCAKAKGDLLSYKIEYEANSNKTNKQTLSEWVEDVESDDEVDEVLYPEGNKFEDQFDIRLKG
ncbi:hypothetical protein Tco_0475801 [Tanacetum coccineum]